MAKTSGINSTRNQSEKRKMPGHGKRITGDSTFKSPRRKRVGKMVTSYRAPEAKPDLTLKNVNAGPVNVDPAPEVRYADTLVKSPKREFPECMTRYAHTRKGRDGSTCDHDKHESTRFGNAHDKDRRTHFPQVTMIGGR